METVSILQDKKNSGGWLHSNVNILIYVVILLLMNCALKMVKVVNLMLVYFSTVLKNLKKTHKRNSINRYCV